MRVCAEESFAGEPFGTAVEGAAAAAVDAGDVAEADIAVAADAVEPHSTDSSVLQPERYGRISLESVMKQSQSKVKLIITKKNSFSKFPSVS